MADNIAIKPATGTGTVPVGADACTVNSVANVQVPLGKLGYGDHGQFTYVSPAAGLPVAAQQAGDTIQVGGAAYTVKRAFANATASGNTDVVPAVPGKK